jgi:hypothetical protein
VSPKVEDGLQIIRNIGGDPGIYFGWIAAHRPTTTEMSALSETEGGAVPDCKPRSPWQSSLCPRGVLIVLVASAYWDPPVGKKYRTRGKIMRRLLPLVKEE